MKIKLNQEILEMIILETEPDLTKYNVICATAEVMTEL